MTVKEKKLKQLMTQHNVVGHLKQHNLNLTDDEKVSVQLVREYKTILYDWLEIKNKIKGSDPNFQLEMYDRFRIFFPTYELMEEMTNHID